MHILQLSIYSFPCSPPLCSGPPLASISQALSLHTHICMQGKSGNTLAESKHKQEKGDWRSGRRLTIH